MTYDTEFYERQSHPSYVSAVEVTKILADILSVQSVIDVGCGVGSWLKACEANLTTDITGVDGEYVKGEQLLFDERQLVCMNLEKPSLDLLPRKRFDLCMSLEVIEHLSPESGEGFLRFLTALSDVILFSGAVPHQGGRNHVNERPHAFWIEKFGEIGFECLDFLRPMIWNNPDICWWYRQNIFVFVRQNSPSLQHLSSLGLEQNVITDSLHPEFMEFIVEKSRNRKMQIHKKYKEQIAALSSSKG